MSDENVQANLRSEARVSGAAVLTRRFWSDQPFETSVHMTVLRRCERCYAPHPRAMQPPLPDGACWRCGALLAASETRIAVPQAHFTTWQARWARVAAIFYRISAWLGRLAERM